MHVDLRSSSSFSPDLFGTLSQSSSSSMYRLENQLPCSHRVALGVSPPEHLDIPLNN